MLHERCGILVLSPSFEKGQEIDDDPDWQSAVRTTTPAKCSHAGGPNANLVEGFSHFLKATRQAILSSAPWDLPSSCRRTDSFCGTFGSLRRDPFERDAHARKSHLKVQVFFEKMREFKSRDIMALSFLSHSSDVSLLQGLTSM